MSSRVAGIALIAVAALTGACASREDWNVWRSHTSHFASGDHGVFSVRNYQVAVSPDRVFQN